MITYDSIKESIILNRLEGWKIQSEEIQDESYLHLDDNNLITSNEVEELFLQAKNQLKNYLVVDELPNDDRLVYHYAHGQQVYCTRNMIMCRHKP